jgi:hypothetical protein
MLGTIDTVSPSLTGVAFAEVTDVFVVDVDVHKAAQLALVAIEVAAGS